MGRTKGILLIVAGALVFTPLFFALGFFLTVWLGDAFTGLSVAPHGYALLALEVALGLWLMRRGWRLYQHPVP